MDFHVYLTEVHVADGYEGYLKRGVPHVKAALGL